MATAQRTWCDGEVRALVPEVLDEVTDRQLANLYAWGQHEELRPWLRANFATSIDGAVADSSGVSAGVSSPDDKRVFALLRALCDAVLVGAGTARTEGYGPVKVRESMTDLRQEAGLTLPPRLVVVTASGRLDPRSPMFTEAPADARTIVVTSSQAPEDNVTALETVADILIAGEDGVDLHDALNQLAGLGLHRLLCEGGPTLFGDLLHEGLVDDLCLTTSPLVVGRGSPPNPGLTGHADPHATARLASLIEAGDSLLARWLFTKDV